MTHRYIDIDYENLQAAIDKVVLEGERIILQNLVSCVRLWEPSNFELRIAAIWEGDLPIII